MGNRSTSNVYDNPLSGTSSLSTSTSGTELFSISAYPSMSSLRSQRTTTSTTTGSRLSLLRIPRRSAPLKGCRAHKRCQRLEASIFRTQVVFCVLVAACVLVLALYVALIGLLLKAWPDIVNVNVNHLQAKTSKVRAFVRIWNVEDRESIRNLMGNYMWIYKPGVRDDYFFKDFKWVVKAFGKVNTAVNDSLTYIRAKQKEINDRVKCYMPDGEETLNICCAENSANVTKMKTPVVFAHLFPNKSYYKDKTDNYMNKMRALRWAESAPRGIRIVGDPASEFIITHAGFYYVYSYVTFNEKVNASHKVILKRNRANRVLLSHTGDAASSNLQGVFDLQPHDCVSVNATPGHVDMRNKHTYFGVYLDRS